MKKALIVIILAAVVCLVVAYMKSKTIIEEAPVACTMEAKQCPDGSYVGRTGPNCEFAACADVVAPQKLQRLPGPIEPM